MTRPSPRARRGGGRTRASAQLAIAAGVLAAAMAAPSTAQAAQYRILPAAPHPALQIAAAPKGATFGGSTSQQSPVVVQLSRDGRKVARLVVRWEAECTSGKFYPFAGILVGTAGPPTQPAQPGNANPFFGNAVSRAGSFKGTGLSVQAIGQGPPAPDLIGVVTQDVGGRLGSSSGGGTWRGHAEVVDPASGQKVDDCQTGLLKWKAPKPQSRFYGGATSAEEPVVVQVSRNRRSVREFAIGWAATCSPMGDFEIADSLIDFRIDRRGSFGDKFTNRYTTESGGENKLDYELRGKVGRAKASGTFEVLLTNTNSAGATTAVCDYPQVTWSAKVGPGKAKRKRAKRR